jgi:type I restriction enzyme S subunit
LTYYLNFSDLLGYITGVTVPKLNQEKMRAIEIPIPSLSEQERIVSLSDAQFAKIDAIKADAEKQLKDAKALFQSALKDYLTPKEGWIYGILGDIAHIVHGKNQKEVADSSGKYPIYGSGGNIMGYAKDYLCDEGTTILGRKGTIDNPQYINTKFWNVDTAFGVCAKNNVDKKFLFYLIKNEDWQSRNTGTTLPSLTQSVVLNVPINYPHTLSEQLQIAEQLDTISAKIKSLQSNFDTTVTLCNDLKQSILKDIFG